MRARSCQASSWRRLRRSGIALCVTTIAWPFGVHDALAQPTGEPGSTEAGPAPIADPAEELFAQGETLEGVKQYSLAATSFEEADVISPNPLYLERAIRAATSADEPMLAMRLVVRAKDRDKTPGLSEAIAAAESRFANQIASVTVRCNACYVQIDGVAADAQKEAILAVGAHTVVASQGPQQESWSLSLSPGERLELEVPWLNEQGAPGEGPTYDQPDAPTREPNGLAPIWFFAATGVTLVAGGITIASALGSQSAASDFDKDPSFQNEVDARRAEYRTFILLTATGAAALGTAAIGLFATDWALLDEGGDAWLGLAPTGVKAGGRF